MTSTDFDKLATIYTSAKINPWNDLYERPAAVEMMGEVAGKKVLDAGCGGGKHSADLMAKGANVQGFDLSANMLDHARQLLGNNVELKVASLDEKLPYKTGSFDAILCSLAMHYLKDWRQPLSEFHRLLKPGGSVVISTHHPFMDHELAGSENYFAHMLIEDSWEKNGETMHVRYWRRSLSQMIREFKDAGFQIEQIDEPMPLAETADQFPIAYEKLTTQPRFIFFKLSK
ncbi:class I SAM-dependent methyltransferase [Maritalea porphyrae]|uniref:Methyltransferase n=1 Tax=Maritalea porphyrae TaxID=880732 RepID=A0ABQ5UMI2_9HYPH|nr:class I SAM-dependent methyltransferase [Maritalea porphyrae]GLQ16496.1 putative methyltransferase [Maritalea porphyrae]